MELIQRLKRCKILESFHSFSGTALVCAIVHYRDGRFDRPKQCDIVANAHPVVSDLVEIDMPDSVHWANEVLLDVPGQIPKIQKPESSVGKHKTHASSIVRRVVRRRLCRCAFRIRRTRRTADGLTTRYYAGQSHCWITRCTLERDRITCSEGSCLASCR